MTAPLIGVIGVKQSGKDTLASYLVNNYGFTRYALADPMREFALALDPIVRVYDHHMRLSEVVANLGWDRAKEIVPEVRRTLQRLGTEAGRGVIGEDFWIDVTDAKVQDTLKSGPVVVTDIRFPNEYDWIKRNGGYLVRVVRPGTVPGEHASERMAQDAEHYPANYTIYNTSTLDFFVNTECRYVGETITDDTLF